jgi:uncharacterized protein (DUF885 family)
MTAPLLAFLLVAFMGSPLIGADPKPAEDEDAKLAAFFRTYLDESFRLSPMQATRLGDHRFDDRLDDLSSKARARWKKHSEKVFRELPEQIDYRKLTRASQIDFEILKHQLVADLWLYDNTRPFEHDPRVYSEYITDSVYLPLEQSTLPRETKLHNSVARIKQIPKIVAAAKENLHNPPRVIVETAIRQNRGAIGFYEHGIFELTREPAGAGDLGAAAREVVLVLKEYQHWLEHDLLPQAKGEWRIGKEKFGRKLELELDADLTAEQVLHEAEAEFGRVERDMYVVARQLWAQAFPGKALPPDDVEGRRQTIRQVLDHYNHDHGKVEELVRDAKTAVARIKSFIKEKDILRLPEPDRCQVIEMPEFQRGNSMAFLNQAPPLDPKAASVYAISPPPREWDEHRAESFMREYNRHMLQILTIHEAYPGHYVQLAYSNRNPSLIRRVLFSGVFAEGWAVYTEQMMLDQGYGDGNLAMRLNQLKWYLRTVANAILDYKMHCADMTDAEALKFLTEGAFQAEGEAVPKLVRAKQSSCQLSTYFVGRTAFYRLRQQIEREMGDKFSLGRFHEAVLDHGTLPVKYLPELVRARLAKPR